LSCILSSSCDTNLLGFLSYFKQRCRELPLRLSPQQRLGVLLFSIPFQKFQPLLILLTLLPFPTPNITYPVLSFKAF